MNRYEISLWEDFQDISNNIPFLNERKLCIIGDDKMTSWTRAREPKMVENINGTHTFTFKVFSSYIDEITGEQKSSPFSPYLINERKVKVFWQDNWYDLIIKNIDEDSSGNSAVYTCKDVFITELSKNGYNIELTSDLQNNSGTASELTEQVLAGSGWRFDIDHSDKIYQYLEQPVYESVISGSDALSVSLVSPTEESKTISIPLSAKVLVLKSSLDGIQEGKTEEREIHIIYAENFQTEQNEMLVINGEEYQFTGNVTRNSDNTFTIIKDNSRVEYLQLSTNYRANGLVRSQRTAYDPLFERYVNVYTDNNGKKVYGFQTTEFSQPMAVINLIANSSNFRNTSGWIGNGVDWMVYPNDWANVNISTYNTVGYLKAPIGSIYNNGISANLNLLQPTTSEIKKGDIGGFHVGDKFIFRAKVKDNLSSSSYIKSDFSFQICEFNLDYSIKGNSYFSSTTINPNSEWYEAELTCTKPCPATELEKLGFFFTNSSGSVLYIEDIQFFKDVQGSEDVINYYTKSQPQLVLNINEANGNTYSFYKGAEAKILIYLNGIPDGYTVEPGTGNGSEYWPLNESIRLKANQSGTTVYNIINMSDNIISTFTVEVCDQIYDSDYIKTTKTYINPGEIYLQGVASTIYKYYNADQKKGILPEEVEFLYAGEEESLDFTPVYTYEKITTVEAKGSNRFNILQSIAENFQCWVRFNIEHESNGKISLDSNGLPKKYVTLVNDVGEDLGWSFIYGIDLKTIKRKIISEDIVTKTIVLDNNNEFGKNGFCSIARSQLNYPRENFILNFDYYIKAGLLDKDEVNADLYYTSNGHIGYLQRLNDWNNQYIESIDVLAQKKLELDKQSSELEVLNSRNKATLEKITSAESDLIKITGTSTLEQAKQYIDSHIADSKINSLMTTIGQLRKDQNELVSQINLLEESVENLKNYVNKQDMAQHAIVSTVKNLHEEFFKKYSRYIQEGTWQSEDYIDDDKYYLDAMEIAHTSAFPKVQYDINVIRVNSLEEFSSKKFNVGDICYIQDKDFFNFITDDGNPYKLQIVISEITSYFDSPEKDVIKVQNYKTQFEDLFQRITATTQSLQYSQGSYAKAAGALNPNGTLKFDLLQQTIDNNSSILMNASNQNVIWDDTGITIKDNTNSAQLLRIMSGGLFVSNDGGLTWKNAVRGDGISTDILTAGRINTGEIFILNDDYPTFRWDSNGITAYSWDNNGAHFNKFVRYDQYGLYGYEGLADFIPEDIDDITSNATFGLTWDGFFMKSSSGNGAVIINSNDREGKVIKSTKNGEETFWLKNTGDASFKGVIHATGLFLDTDEARETITDLIPEYELQEQDVITILQNNGYVDADTLSSELNDYATKNDLNGYATTSALNTVDGKFSNYVMTTAADGKYIIINAAYSNGTHTENATTANGGYIFKSDGALWAENAFINGTVVANSGLIGGWSINPPQKTIINGKTYNKIDNFPTGSLYYTNDQNQIGVNGTIFLIPSGDLQTATTIAGSPTPKKDWRLTIGSNFGVDSSGNVYATNGHFTGSISASSLELTGDAETVVYNMIDGKISENNGVIASTYVTESSLSGYIKINQTYGRTTFSYDVEEQDLLRASNLIVEGTVYSTNGRFAGEVVASSGDIGGWHIAAGQKETWPARNIDNNTIIGSDTMKPNKKYTYLIRVKDASARNKWYGKNAENTSVWLDGQGTLTTPSGVVLTYNSYELNTNYRAIDLTYTTFSSNTSFVLAFAFASGDSTSRKIKVQQTSDSTDTENGIPATEGFSIKKDYWNRFVPEGALYAPDYLSASDVAGITGELFDWYPNNILPSGTGSNASTDEKFKMIPWRGIYLSPINNDKAYIKIPGSTATDGSNLKDDWRLIIGNNFGVDSLGVLYANEGHFTGEIQSSSGKIGNWTIASDRLYYSSNNSTEQGEAGKDRFLLCPVGVTRARNINGNYRTDWRILCGNNFGLTKDGTIYAVNGHFTGTLSAGAITPGVTFGQYINIATSREESTGEADQQGISFIHKNTSAGLGINSNGVWLRNSKNQWAFLNGEGWTAPSGSDMRLKENIIYNLTNYKNILNKLNVFSYTLKESQGHKIRFGVSAQQLHQLLLDNDINVNNFPFLLLPKEGSVFDPNDASTFYQIDYQFLPPLLLSIIQDQQKEIEQLKTMINEL